MKISIDDIISRIDTLILNVDYMRLDGASNMITPSEAYTEGLEELKTDLMLDYQDYFESEMEALNDQ